MTFHPQVCVNSGVPGNDNGGGRGTENKPDDRNINLDSKTST